MGIAQYTKPEAAYFERIVRRETNVHPENATLVRRLRGTSEHRLPVIQVLTSRTSTAVLWWILLDVLQLLRGSHTQQRRHPMCCALKLPYIHFSLTLLCSPAPSECACLPLLPLCPALARVSVVYGHAQGSLGVPPRKHVLFVGVRI